MCRGQFFDFQFILSLISGPWAITLRSQLPNPAKPKKISNTKKGKGNYIPSKPVMINELNKKFESITECADYINGDISAICKCLNKRGQTRHRGYTFSRI